MNTDIEFLEHLGADLAEAGEREIRYGERRTRRRPSKRLVAVLVAATLAVAATIGYLVPRHSSSSGEAAISNSLRRNALGPELSPGSRKAVSRDQRTLLAPGAQTIYGPSTHSATQSAGRLSGRLPLAGPRIIKTASATIVVKRGAFMHAFDQASSITASSGGFVQTSSTFGSPARSGILVIRVPAKRFDQTLSELRALGTVQSQSVSGQDVTARYVDLQGRIDTWASQEQALIRLMARATTIGETLSIQSRLQQVQLTIEQLKGQLRVLRNQTAEATISVTLREAGVRPVHHQQNVLPSFGRGWDRAVGGFLGVLVSVLIGLGYLIPIAAVAALAWALSRPVRRRLFA